MELVLYSLQSIFHCRYSAQVCLAQKLSQWFSCFMYLGHIDVSDKILLAKLRNLPLHIPGKIFDFGGRRFELFEGTVRHHGSTCCHSDSKQCWCPGTCPEKHSSHIGCCFTFVV